MKQSYWSDAFDSITWLISGFIIGAIGAVAIVTSKPPEDYFACFNRLGSDRSYSIF